MLKTNQAVCICMAIFAAGCVSRPTVTIDTSSITEADVAPYQEVGTASISGQGFLRQRGGGVVTCAGSEVVLAPDLPVIRQAIAVVTAGNQVVPNTAGPRWEGVTRKTQCDAQGNFRFENLPAVPWYVLTQVVWEIGNNRNGGALAEAVVTTAGEHIEVLLTDEDVIAR